MNDIKTQLQDLYGENKKIIDDNYDKTLAVKCINGTFVGKKTDNIIEYKGIPFVGRQPVGEYRWKAPVDFVSDDGVYEAYYNAKSSCQGEGFPAYLYGCGEDCLYLNVWKADDGGTKKPVMVWIHGGAFETGGTIEDNCHNLVKENPEVIIVNTAYRLGALGFLHLSHLSDGKDYPDAQNLGLLDQIAALKWVHENIENFGGDPNNVTIFGESAGAASCTLIPLIKGSQAYFKRVIAQSGSPGQTQSTEEAIACTNEIMDALGCKTVADMLKVDAKKLTNTVTDMFGLLKTLQVRTIPERDGNYLPLDLWAAYANGAAKNIDFLQGCNKDEMNTFAVMLGEEFWKKWVVNRKSSKKFAKLTDDEKALLESYCNDFNGEEWERTSRLFSQSWFIAPQIRLSEEQTKAGGKSYTYYFTVESAVPMIKSGHAIELTAIFNNTEDLTLSGRIFDETFSKTMRKMWVQFAKTGNPSLSADISPDGKAKVWPLYDLENKQVMVLDEFNIHTEKESVLKIVDWDRTYFLTNYYCI